MTDCEAWNKIVALYNKNLNCQEDIIQTCWETLFSTIFNYDYSNIVSQYPVKMGVETKRADVVIKRGNNDLFVVELKRHTLHDGQAQLFSYLNQLKIDIGILVCDKLYIYNFDYAKKDNNFTFVEINFTPDNPEGIKFIELFKSENIEKQKIKDFIAQNNQSKSNIASIKNELTQSNVVQIIKKYLTEKYPVDDVEAALAGINIVISTKNIAGITKTAVSTFTRNNGQKDDTQYTMNGTPTRGKGPTVFAAVQCYVDSHPGITFSQLQEVFPDGAAKPGFNKMVRRIEEIKDKSRFKYLFLSDGTRVGVSTQWKPENMQSFIRYAAMAGIDIKPIG